MSRLSAMGHGGSCEVVIAVAWDCPFDGRTRRRRPNGGATCR